MATAQYNTRRRWRQLVPAGLLICLYCGSGPLSAQQAAAEKPADETPAAPPAPQQAQDPVPEQAKDPAPAVSDKIRLAQQQQRLLSELQGPPEVVWIEVDGGKVLAFWTEDQSNKPVGAVVLLHAQGQNPRWSDTLLRLHHHLPLHGWAALSIELPELPEPGIPERIPDPTAVGTEPAQTDPSQPVDETNVVHQEPAAGAATAVTPTSPAAPPAQITATEARAAIQRRIAAATQYLQQKGQYNLVLLGEGASALWALEHLGQATVPEAPKAADPTRKVVLDRPIRALIMLDLRVPESLPEQELSERLRHPDVPTLDAYTDFSATAREAANLRKRLSIKAGYRSYVQKRLPPAGGVAPIVEETNLIKTLRGFLQQHARGEQLDQGLGGSSGGGSSAGI